MKRLLSFEAFGFGSESGLVRPIPRWPRRLREEEASGDSPQTVTTEPQNVDSETNDGQPLREPSRD